MFCNPSVCGFSWVEKWSGFLFERSEQSSSAPPLSCLSLVPPRVYIRSVSLSLCGSLSPAHGGQPARAPGPGHCRVGHLHHRLHTSEQQPVLQQSPALLPLGERDTDMFVMVFAVFSVSLISHVAMNCLSVNFPQFLCSVWVVWVMWDALCGTVARVPRVASARFLLWKQCWCYSLSAPRLSIQRGFSLSMAHRTNTRHKASPLPLFLFHSPALKRVETAVHRPAEDLLAALLSNISVIDMLCIRCVCEFLKVFTLLNVLLVQT